MLPATFAPPGDPPGFPFRGPSLATRLAPFAVAAVLAEASLALPPYPASAYVVLVSVLLLLAVPAEFLLPWERLPSGLAVLVPLTYLGSVLALVLADGPASGVGVAVLIPLVWTALFHRPWESACVVAGIVAVELVISLTPVMDEGSVVARRVILWALLAGVTSLGTHGLRERIRRSQERSAQLQSRLRQLTVLADRDRIAADLRDKVIQRIFAAGLTLQSAASRAPSGEVRRRIEASVEELDQAVRTLRDAIFGLVDRPDTRTLRQEVMALCEDLPPGTEISFGGPVDAALSPGARAHLVDMLREALEPIRKNAVPARISVTAGDRSCATVIDAGPVPAEAAVNWPVGDFPGLRDRAAAAGIGIGIENHPGGTRFAWHLPLS